MRKWFTLVALGLFTAGAFAAEIDLSALEKYVAEQLAATGTPGVALCVIVDRKVAYTKGFGVASVETGMPVTPEMLFRLGSTTKMFTAAALLTLAEEGKLDLHQPIGIYLKGLASKLAQVTTDQLLSHTAGIRDFAPMFGPHDDTELAKRVRALKDSDVPLEPGAIISYSNPGYWVAGMVLEEIAGNRYADAVEERVLRPAGMTRSTFRPLTAMTYPLAIGHSLSFDRKPVVIRPFADDASTWPSGSLFSNVNELARFAIALMSAGKFEGKQVLSSAIVARMTAPHSSAPGGKLQYGYGLMLSEAGGLRTVGHGGARAGYGSTLMMVPHRGFAVVVLANRTAATMQQIADKALEVVLGVKPSPPPKPASLQMTEEEMTACAGKFSDSEISIELFVKDGQLMFKGMGKETGVTKIGDGQFRTGGPPPNEFQLVPGGTRACEYLHSSLRSLRRVQ